MIDYGKMFKDAGIEKGDIVDVAADTLSIMLYYRENRLKFKMDDLIDAIAEAVGEEGTVMLRTFNFDFCHGVAFDIKTTPSQVGSLGNYAMKRKDFKRTAHPLYSWMVKGKYQKELTELNNKNAFGEGSVFDFQYKHGAKLLCLGNLDYSGFTQNHHAEAMVGIPYRFEKDFTGDYIGYDGKVEKRTYSMLVRYLDCSSRTDIFDYTRKEMEEQGIITNAVDSPIKCHSFKIKEGVDYDINDLKNNYGKNIVLLDGKRGYEDFVDFEFKMK